MIRPAPAAHAPQAAAVWVLPLPAAQSVTEEPVHIEAGSRIEVPTPPAVSTDVAPMPVQKSWNPVTRAAKSVGRLLHFGHGEKYQPPVVVPVPASIEEK